ncbi:MAG: phage terminase large subunit [Methylocystaceae bacterium]|nr:phage terminase large subunit [Methylocystaceae bacterium]
MVIKGQKKRANFGSQDFLDDIAALARTLRDEIEAAADLGNFERSDAAAKARRDRSYTDFRFFQDTYFPHYGTAAPSEFHLWIDKTLPAAIDSPQGERWGIGAPRGNAKSTKITQMLVLWAYVTGRKKFPIILSDAIEVASMLLEGIKVELEDNPRLNHDYPDYCGRGPVWQVGTIVTRKNCKFMAGGAGKRIRGARHGSQRPDITILDDVENDENVRQTAQRDKTEDWIDKAVEPLGPPDLSMDIFYVGTILHFDSVLNRKIKSPMWKSIVFQAIQKWPDRMDLWEQWEEIIRNEGMAEAELFYNINASEMERGSKVLWPAVQPLKRLMEMKVRLGNKSFNSEYQNTPIDTDNQLFGDIVFWVERASGVVIFGAADPSLGKKSQGRDPSAILVGAYNRENGQLDVLEASIRKRLPSIIISDIISFQKEYRCVTWFIESVQFQEFLRTELMKEAARQGVVLPARPVIPNTDKELRIESLQPLIQGGLIRLHASQTILINQLQTFPQGHDDGPDCLHMLVTGAVEMGSKVGNFVSAGNRTFANGVAGTFGVSAGGIINSLRGM